MKKNDQRKNSPEGKTSLSAFYFIKAYFSNLVQAHKKLGPLRVIPSYIFALFAIISFLFTVRVPVTSDFLPPEGWEKMQSRLITGGIMVANVLIYGAVLSWRKDGSAPLIIRIAFIAIVLYVDIFLVGRTLLALIKDGVFF